VFVIVRAVPESLEITAPFITKLPKPNAASFPTYTDPEDIVAGPANVFAPLNVNAPVPLLVNETAPPTTPDKTTSLAVVSVVFDVNVPPPINVSNPFRVAFPSVTAPPKLYAFASVRPCVPSLETVDAKIATDPVPNAASFPT
jgi:hypothetical protein